MRFFDASAVMKNYVPEAEGGEVAGLLAASDVAISQLTLVEVASGLARLAREGATTAIERDRAVDLFRDDAARWIVVPIDAAVVRVAQGLVIHYPLRTGDAIQLASARLVHEDLGRLDAFVSFDRRLNDAARAEGLAVPAI